MQSHIFPKLIYKRIRSHPKSRFRSLDNFSKAMQDGEKRPMLCHDCEERFSAFESKFATLFLDPYLESEKLKNLHSTWVNYYFLSVAWRVLWDDLYRMKSHCEHFSRHIFEEYCDELGKCLLAFKDGANSKIPKQFKTRVYKLNRLIKQSEVNELAKGCIFGYSVFLAKSHSFSVIVYYAGLVFVTDYIPDKRRYIFLGGKPTLFKTRCKKKEVTEELKIQFCEMAQQYKKVMTPDMRKKISERYNKWCAKGIFSVDTRQKSPEISTVSGLLLFSVYLRRAFLCLICVLQSKKCVSAGKKAGQDQHLTGFSFCRCFSCRSALFLLVRHNNVGELLCDLRRLFIRRRDDMRVNIGGRAHLSMSQAAGDYDERRSLCNQ